MPTLLQLRWEYTLKNLFEDRLATEFDGYPITLDDGAVLATLPMVAGDTRSPLRKAVEFYVESIFLGVQVAAHTECQLGRPSASTLNDEGSRGYILECETGVARVKGGCVDLSYTRSDGTVVDTRRERIDRKHRLSLAAASYGSDEALARMLRSYRVAISDKDDELIHLYEVRDSLLSVFGSKPKALRKLGTTERAWNRLGELCNVLPLRQGRHRGCVGQPIRSASDEELEEARSLAASFIESYLQHLGRNE